MIKTFGGKLAEVLYYDAQSKETRQFSTTLRRVARRKLLYLHDAISLNDLRVPPGNRLESLRGDKKGFYSIHINDQWRLVFRWEDRDAYKVSIVDYH